MGIISIRLRSLEPEIVAAVEATPPERCRKLALHIAEHVLRYAEIHNKPAVLAALQSLRAEKLGDSAEKQALLKLARELDDAALDIGELLEQGKATEAEQTIAIAKARAADTLLAVFEDNPEEALADAVYEAYFAVDADAQLIHKWLTEYDSV
jgi:hypothetical protein